MTGRFTPATTALMLIDMQNDFLHPKGAYGRAGLTSAAIAELPARLKPVAAATRKAGGWIVSTHFTLVPGKGGEPMITPHLKKLRPFLAKGDFLPGTFGHDLIDDLKPADLAVEKVAFSAFYMSRLEFVLRKAGIETLVFFSTALLSDGCGAFDTRVHDATVSELSSVSTVMTCADFTAAIAA
jgi:ureidoacrylate peracid hydrolase